MNVSVHETNRNCLCTPQDRTTDTRTVEVCGHQTLGLFENKLPSPTDLGHWK
jgi:hypothetical protein